MVKKVRELSVSTVWSGAGESYNSVGMDGSWPLLLVEDIKDGLSVGVGGPPVNSNPLQTRNSLLQWLSENDLSCSLVETNKRLFYSGLYIHVCPNGHLEYQHILLEWWLTLSRVCVVVHFLGTSQGTV